MADLPTVPPGAALAARLAAIMAETQALGFTMASEPVAGALIRALAASKPSGALLELGTGTGLSTAWLLDGMGVEATLVSVDTDDRVQQVAQRHLGADARLTFHLGDGGRFVEEAEEGSFDLIFADAWPGKYSHRAAALTLLKPGGLYIVDDMLPQPNWPESHQANVDAFIAEMNTHPDFTVASLSCGSGLMVATKKV